MASEDISLDPSWTYWWDGEKERKKKGEGEEKNERALEREALPTL